MLDRSFKGVCDPFEPTFVQVAFERAMHLGPLIFGASTWKRLGGKRSLRVDPLTTLFTEKRACAAARRDGRLRISSR